MADLGDTEGFDKDGKENRLYAFQLSEGVYKRKSVTLEGVGSPTFGGLSDIDTSVAVPKQLHTLAYTGRKWVVFADPVQQTGGWLIDIRIASPYVWTGKGHKLRKVVNSGTRLCSFIPKTKNIVVSEGYTLGTNGGRQGVLKMASEFPPAGLIGLGLPTSTILLEIFLGDRPDDFVDVIPGFKLKWPAKHANKHVGARIIVKETPQVDFTLGEMEQQTEYRFLDIGQIFLGPVSLKRLRLTPGELTHDQTTVIIEQ
ncbi:MAG: hypothetical protein KZQ77_20090 [Candidatus Thiodiazotropha sp. (ex Notomyrtea botanica)]|nr:hypothetical protein [Candidatus Thiodiazotropha sp. (ex Notomyrtea botanica)]